MDDVHAGGELSRRALLRYGIGTAGAAALGSTVLAACGSSGSATKAAIATTDAPTTTASAMGGPGLLKAAKAEGGLTTCALGTEHSYYVPVIDAFEKYAGFKVDTKNPTYIPSLAVKDVADAAKAGQKPPYDLIEITQSVANQTSTKDIVEQYVSSRWTDIPSVFKDPDGNWSASYFGVVAFVVNTNATDGFLPVSWDELANSSKTPKGSFAMLGDPRTGQPLEGGLALLTVMSAAIANNGSLDDAEAGLKLLGELVDKGIFDLSDSTSLLALPDNAGTKDTPINALFSFDFPLAKDNGRRNLVTVQSAAPSDGLIAGFYADAIVKNAVHPEAAKLWIEFTQSDEAAAVFLANGAYPTRHSAIAASGSKALRDTLEKQSDEANAPVPTVAQINSAQKTVDELWTKYIPVKD